MLNSHNDNKIANNNNMQINLLLYRRVTIAKTGMKIKAIIRDIQSADAGIYNCLNRARAMLEVRNASSGM